MGKVVDITDILLFKRAVRILESLRIDYDYDKLRARPELCKEIIVLFEDDLDILLKHKLSL